MRAIFQAKCQTFFSLNRDYARTRCLSSFLCTRDAVRFCAVGGKTREGSRNRPGLREVVMVIFRNFLTFYRQLGMTIVITNIKQIYKRVSNRDLFIYFFTCRLIRANTNDKINTELYE